MHAIGPSLATIRPCRPGKPSVVTEGPRPASAALHWQPWAVPALTAGGRSGPL
jgi:hypothetical protein